MGLQAMLLFLPLSLFLQTQDPLAEEIRGLKDPDAAIRANKANLVGNQGAKASEAVPALRQLLSDQSDKVRFEASIALLKIDQKYARESIQELEKLLGLRDSPFSLQILLRTQEIIPASRQAIEGALRLARSKDPAISTTGLLLLDNLGPASREGSGVLEKAVDDPNWAIRIRVAAGLARMDSRYQQKALQILESALQQAGETEHFLAARLILSLEPTHEKSRVVIVNTLANKDPNRRRDAIETLVSLGREGKFAQDRIRKLLEDEDPDVKLAAIEGLMRIMPEKAKELLGTLIKIRDPEGKQGFRRILTLIEQIYQLTDPSRPEESLQIMAEQLRRPARNDQENLRKLDAIIRIAALGPKATPARLDLIRALEDPSPLIRSQAIHALEMIGPVKTSPGIPDPALVGLEKLSLDPGVPSDLRDGAVRAIRTIKGEKR